MIDEVDNREQAYVIDEFSRKGGEIQLCLNPEFLFYIVASLSSLIGSFGRRN